MMWTCAKCGTKHDTVEERQACKKAQRATTLLAVGLLAALTLAGLGGKIAWSVYAYGDWTCAFAECRKIKP